MQAPLPPLHVEVASKGDTVVLVVDPEDFTDGDIDENVDGLVDQTFVGQVELTVGLWQAGR